jgi:hypothetical protein
MIRFQQFLSPGGALAGDKTGESALAPRSGAAQLRAADARRDGGRFR